VLALIFVFSALLPDEIKIGTLTFRSPDLQSWFKPNTKEYKDIQDIIAFVDTTDFQHIHSKDTISSKIDSIIDNNKIEIIKLKSDNFQKSISASLSISTFEYPSGQDTLLFPFFRVINKKRQSNIRILHYGDSQIEGDHITSTIRAFMHKNFGGQGIGFIPIVPVADVATTFQQNVSPNWKRFSVLDKQKINVTNNRFGISGNFVRYAPVNQNDTVAVIGLQPYYYGSRNVQTFTHVRLFYGQAQNPFSIIVNKVSTQTLQARNLIASTLWRFESSQNSLHLQLMPTSDLPDLYGISLDGEQGVAVDNLPLRGSAGFDFSRMDTTQMREMFSMMDVEMLILQFGGNIFTIYGDNHNYYYRRFLQELLFLKSLKPGIVIIVIGINDISQNTPDGYITHPNVTKIRDAQKRAAFEADCVFWDLYRAMGGDSSMPSWVFAEPPLAKKDFLHFTSRGAKIVGEMFCKAFAFEYQKFSEQMNN